MRLSQLQEASYHGQSEWVDWVRQQFNKVGSDAPGQRKHDDEICLGHEREVSVQKLEEVIRDLTRAFGKPDKTDPYNDKLYQWGWDVGEYTITAFAWGIGRKYTGICVGKK
jgi:hypothetical protein